MNKKEKIGWLFAATLAARFIAQSVISAFGENITQAGASIINQLILLVPTAIFIISCRDCKIKHALRLKGISFGNVILVVVFAFLVMPLLNLISAISLLISQNHIAQGIESIVDNGLLPAMVSVAIIPAIVEETIFRGAMYNQYSKINRRAGILLSAFLFGLLHLNFNQFCYAFVMGIIMSLLIEATDTIVAPMLVHFVINGYSVLLTFLTPKLLEYYVKLGGSKEMYAELLEQEVTSDVLISSLPVYMISSIIFSVLLGFFVFRTIANNTNRWNYVKGIWRKDRESSQEQSNEQGSVFSTPLIVSVVICIVLIIVNR